MPGQQSATNGQVLKWNGTNWLPENDNSGSSYWQQSGNDIYFNTGKVGIGKIPETDLRQFQVLTDHKLAVVAVNSSDTYPAIYAENNGSGLAADFRNNIRIFDGTQAAGKVLTSDADGYTSWEIPSGGGFTLPYIGSVISADPAFEVINNGDGLGIKVTTVTAPGIFSTTLSSTGRALFGLASAATGNNHGVYGISNSTTGRGVTGWAPASTGMAIGVVGITESNEGAGVYGLATQSTGTSIGVKGMVSSDTGYSGYFEGGKFYVSGNVGIGNHYPAYKLDVKGDSRIQLTKTTGQWIAMRTDGDFLDFSFSGHNLVIKSENKDENILLNPASTNKVGIRTWTPQYDLDVNGNIRVIGEIYYGGSTTGTTTTKYTKPDYVFDNKYKLFKIEEVEKFIEKENHLPWITSAKKEKEENGHVIDMTRMAFETLESVENLQLQLIGQQKQIRELKAENNQLKYRLEKLEQLVGESAYK